MIEGLKQVLQKAPRAIGIMAVQHFEDNFTKGGFVNDSLQKWKPRKHDADPGRAILVGKGSGRLSRSIRVIRTGKMRVVVGTDIEYAAIHNTGGTTHPTVTPAMKRWAWAMYKRTKSSRYKAIAMSKTGKKLTVKIPKRKFIGNSKALDREINKYFKTEIKKAFN